MAIPQEDAESDGEMEDELLDASSTPTATLEPTAAPPTETPDPPTDTPQPPTPTDMPPTAVPPTEPPPVALEPHADRNCDEFADYDQMVAWRNYWIARGVPNPGRLDGDGDGIACEDGEGGRPAPQPQQAAPAEPPAEAPPPRACCKYCTPGRSKPCGDSCISINYNCHKGPGCACMGP